MIFRLIRTLRTSSSERFLIQSDSDQDVAGIDIHYLADGSVVGTVIVLGTSDAVDVEVDALLTYIDECLLPMASLNEKNLSFTVLVGRVIGQFENES